MPGLYLTPSGCRAGDADMISPMRPLRSSGCSQLQAGNRLILSTRLRISPSDEPRVNRLAGQANVDTAHFESLLTIVLNFGVAPASNSPGMSRLIMWGRISAAGRICQGPKLTCHIWHCFVMVILSTQNPQNCRTHPIDIKLCYVLGANHGEGYLLVSLVGCKQSHKNERILTDSEVQHGRV